MGGLFGGKIWKTMNYPTQPKTKTTSEEQELAYRILSYNTKIVKTHL